MKNSTESLMVMMADIAPLEILLDLTVSSINEWKSSPTDENYNKVMFHVQLILTKNIVGRDGVDGLLQGFEEFKEMRDEKKKPGGGLSDINIEDLLG